MFTKSMSICGLLLVAMSLGFCGCATPTGELSPTVHFGPPSGGALGGLPDVTVGATTGEGPSLIPSGSLTAKSGECGPELVGQVKHHLDEPLAKGFRLEQRTTIDQRVYMPCPEAEPEEPQTSPASAPPTEAEPSSSYHFEGGTHGQAPPDRHPAKLWKAPEPHARSAHASILRILWRRGEVMRV